MPMLVLSCRNEHSGLFCGQDSRLSEEAALTNPDKIARSYKCGHISLTAMCRLFRSDESRVAVLQGEHPFEIVYVGRHEDLCTSLLLYEPYANVSSQKCRFLALRAQFHSNHRVNLSTPRYCQSATFGRLTFCVYPLLFYGIRV